MTDKAADRPAKRVKFNAAVAVAEFLAHPAAATVTFHLLTTTTAEELEREIAQGGIPFKGEFYNQVFGEAEEISGYEGLQVHVWLAANSFHCWVDVSYQAKQPGADDVSALLAAWWKEPFTTDRQEFISCVTAEPARDFSALGPPLDTSALPGSTNSSGSSGPLKLYHAQLSETPDWFRALHRRLEPLLVFTIDGASFVDADDDKWEVVAAVAEESSHQRLVGFMMLYNFYAWPLSSRPRVAQGKGFGKALVAAAYCLARQRDAVDLTFEDPAPALQRLREKLEVEQAAATPWAAAAADNALAAAAAEEQRQLQAARALLATRAGAGAASKQQQQRGVAGAKGEQGGAGREQQQASDPVSLLELPPGLQQRLTVELKIHKHQVPAVWEALLFCRAPGAGSSSSSNTGAKGTPALHDCLAELVAARQQRLGAALAGRSSSSKVLVEVAVAAGQRPGENWFVYKVPRRAAAGGAGGGGGLGELLSETVNVGGRHNITQMPADEWSERLQQLSGDRLQELMQLRQRLASGSQQPPAQQHDAQKHQ